MSLEPSPDAKAFPENRQSSAGELLEVMLEVVRKTLEEVTEVAGVLDR